MEIAATTKLETVNCSCGGTYAISQSTYNKCRESGGNWHCPYCRGSISFGESTVDELKKKIDRVCKQRDHAFDSKRLALAEAEHFRRSRDGMKGALAKVKKRVGKGVCPCCNRHFANLQRHMETKHPEASNS